MSVYQFSALNMKGENVPLSDYEGNVMLIVNTASQCGFTSQFTDLQQLYEQYKDQGFVILGFPCNQFMNQDPGTNQDILNYCQLNYGVTFPMFEKVIVNGDDAHPLFHYVTHHGKGFLGIKSIKWNFTKFLINKKGEVVRRYAPTMNPKAMKEEIESILQQ